MTSRVFVLAALLAASACAPRARPLVGVPAPATLPTARLSTRPRRVVFRWQYAETGGFEAKGEGVARLVGPDSARMDFFLDGGLGGGYAILIGDRLTTPGPDLIKRYLPPVPLLWASLGRLAVPSAADTTARVSGDTVQADIGRDPIWRVTFVAGRMTRLDRIDGGRLAEWVTRDSDSSVSYRHETARRGLGLTIVRTEDAAPFDPSIWGR